MNSISPLEAKNLYKPLGGPAAIGAVDTPILLYYWRAIERRRWIVGGIIVVALILGLVATLLMTPKYTAYAQIEISRVQDNVTNVESLQGEDNGQNLEFYQTQYALLATKSLATRVARSLNLANDPAFTSAFNIDREEEGDVAPQRTSSGQSQVQRDTVQALRDHIIVSPVRGSSLADVGFSSPNPVLSAQIVNSWTTQFIEASLDRRFASTADARKFLEGRLAQLREKLEDSERELVSYATNKRIIPLAQKEDAQGKTSTERTLVGSNFDALNSELASATAARIVAESALKGAAGISSGLLNNTTVNGLRQERALLQAQYAKLMTQFEPRYPAAKALQSQIAELDRSIATEEGRVQSNVASTYSQARARENELQQRANALEGELIAERGDQIQYNIYQREVDTNRELYDALLQRYKEIGVAGVGANTVAVVDRAEPPEKPSSPNLPLNLLLSVLGGVFVAGLTVFTLEQVDQSLRDPADVNRLLGVALLGSIPIVRDVEVVSSLEDRKSALSEAYLSVKTNLSFLTEHGMPRSLMLTSTAPNEGKSVSSYALAQTLARTGSSVALIDADMRNPSVGNFVPEVGNHGLSNYLSGQDDWRQLLKQTEMPGFAVMGAGKTPPNAGELLSGVRMRLLIGELLRVYDHVIVDTPPILGIADAPLLSSAVEGVVLTIEANRHKIKGIQNALRRLYAANAHVLGAIVTKLDERNAAYGYGYDYGYGYGSRQGSADATAEA